MTAATCAACGETHRPTARFCGACGTPSPSGRGTVAGEQDPDDTVITAATRANQPDPDRTVSAAFVLAGVAVVALLVIFTPISDIEIEGVT